MVHKPEAGGGLYIFWLRRKRILFAAAVCILLFAVTCFHANRAQAKPVMVELSTLTLSDQNGSPVPDFDFSSSTRNYELVVSGSVSLLNVFAEAANGQLVSISPLSPVPLLWGSNRISIGTGEGSSPYILTVHRGAKTPYLHTEELFIDYEISQKISSIKPTEDGGLIALGINHGASELYKFNELGEVTARSMWFNTRLKDVLEMKKNRYLVVGTREELLNDVMIQRPFAAIYEARPRVGSVGSFELAADLYSGNGEEGLEPASLLRIDNTDEYIIVLNRRLPPAAAVQLYHVKINADSVPEVISSATISGTDSYFAKQIIKARGSDHYLLVGQIQDRITSANRGFIAKIHDNAAAGTLSLVNDFGTEGIVKSVTAPMEFVSAAPAGDDHYVILSTRESLEPDAGKAELHFIKEDGSFAAEAKPLPDLYIPSGYGALAGTPDGGFIVGGRTRFDLSPTSEVPSLLSLSDISGGRDVNQAYVYKFGASLEEQWKKTIGAPGQIIDATAVLPLVNGDIWVAGGLFENWGDFLWTGYVTKLLGSATLNGIEPADLTYVKINDSGTYYGYLDDTRFAWSIPGNVNRMQGLVDRKPGQTVRVNGKELPENEPADFFLPEVSHTVTIEVTAEDQQTKKQYVLDIIKSLPGQATVTGVTYNGTPLILYESLQTFYMPVASSVYQADLNVMLSEPSAVFDFFPPEGITRDMNRIHIESLPYGQPLSLGITVFSSEGIPSRWTVIIGPPSNEAELKRLYPQSPSVIVEQGTDRFTVTVPKEMLHVTLDPKISDYASIVQVAGAHFNQATQAIEVPFLREGSNPVTVVVQAQSGLTRTFVIDVVRQPSPDVGAVVPSLRPVDHLWFEVTMSVMPADAAIYYTVDGSDPASSSALYDPVNKPRLLPGQILKAIGMKQGRRTSPMLVLTGPELEYPGSPDVSYIVKKINDRVDIDGGGFGKSDVEYWLKKIKPVKVAPVPPKAG